MDLYVFTFHKDKMVYRALSPLTPEEVEAYGLPTEAVLGQISALLPSMTPDQFEENEAFVTQLHEVVQEQGAAVSDLQVEAKGLGTGELLVLDRRAGLVTGQVEPEDIIGRFDVSRGEIRPESYQANDKYRLLTDNGPLQLPEELETVLIARIRAIAAASREEER